MGKTVREHPAPHKNAVMDDDDQRDYEDYNYEPPQVHDGDGGSGDSDDLKAFLRVLVDRPGREIIGKRHRNLA